jgi:hypothetical protein
MIKPFNRHFKQSDDTDGGMMPDFNVNLSADKKVYEQDGKTLEVWSLAGCIVRCRKAVGTDPLLKGELKKLDDWREKQATDPMTKAWADDCYDTFIDAFEIVLQDQPESQAPPPVQQKKSLFNKDQ